MADNAALRRAEEALRASEARLGAIIGQAAVGIGETDLSGRFLLANDRHCAILGRPREELLAGLRMQADLAQREGANAEDLKQSLRQIGRSSIRATVCWPARRIMSAAPIAPNHSELKRTSVRASSSTLNTWSR